MKKITTLLFILLAMPIYAQWVLQNSGASEKLVDVYCITADVVVVVGNAGTILKTTDGGENWVQKNSGTTYDLMKVQFPSPNVGYVIGRMSSGGNGILLKTIDGGENWTSIDLGESIYVLDISCVNEDIFYITCNNSFKKTINGGASFETVNTTANIDNIQFLTESTGYGSNYDTFYKTVDGGTTWSVVLEVYIPKFFFITENTGFINGTNGNYKTTDGGINLSPAITSYGQPIDIFALNENVIWEVNGYFTLCGCPPNYCIAKSDTVENQIISSCNLGGNTTNPLNAIHFANETTGFVVGYGGAIYKNSTGTMEEDPAGVDEFDKNDAVKIYPNPASDQITIAFNETPAQPFYIEITDCLGKKIYSKSYQPENFTTINVASFSKGFYFVTIISQEQRQTQKIIVN